MVLVYNIHRGVYPRGCGGATLTVTDVRVQRGLSPRVRGSRADIVHTVAPSGSIPAGAGEPPQARFA